MSTPEEKLEAGIDAYHESTGNLPAPDSQEFLYMEHRVYEDDCND